MKYGCGVLRRWNRFAIYGKIISEGEAPSGNLKEAGVEEEPSGRLAVRADHEMPSGALEDCDEVRLGAASY